MSHKYRNICDTLNKNLFQLAIQKLSCNTAFFAEL